MMGLLVLVQRREDGMARHINSYHAIWNTGVHDNVQTISLRSGEVEWPAKLLVSSSYVDLFVCFCVGLSATWWTICVRFDEIFI
jgi:hypothetical protein